MSEYDDKLVQGSAKYLNETQKAYLGFEEYTLRDKYEKFLEIAANETEMQYFLEANPILIPGLYDLHNGPKANIVVSKLKLSDEYVTDFAFVSVNSATSLITLIEIESPTTKVFRASDDEFTSAFNKAYQQVRDWELWATQNATHLKDTFRRVYYKNIFKYHKVMTRHILIAGRRSEIQQSPRREKRWASVNQNPATFVMTYDRLSEMFIMNARLLKELICRPANQVYRAIKALH